MPGTPVCAVTFPLVLVLVLVLVLGVAPSTASSLQPCQPVNQTVSVEKEGCPTCLVLETSICSGHCLTKEPVFRRPSSDRVQHVCTYRDVRYEIVRLPDCPPGVDPFVTLPRALTCDCSMCTMDNSDCTIESLEPDFCMTQRYLEPAYY